MEMDRADLNLDTANKAFAATNKASRSLKTENRVDFYESSFNFFMGAVADHIDPEDFERIVKITKEYKEYLISILKEKTNVS